MKCCSNEINLKMIQPHCTSCSSNLGFKSFCPLWTYQIEPVFTYVSFNTQTVKIVVKTHIHMHWSLTNLKIKIFREFRVFVLSPTPKNENSEITEILQKRQNTEMWECRFKKHQTQNHSATLLITYLGFITFNYLGFKSFWPHWVF